MITEESGSHFDPAVINAFREIDDATFVAIGRDAW
jgi:response regulator RpfG family c-di-GMP phosphodiesterase